MSNTQSQLEDWECRIAEFVERNPSKNVPRSWERRINELVQQLQRERHKGWRDDA